MANTGKLQALRWQLPVEGFEPKIHRTFLIKKNMPMLSLASCMIFMFDGNASHIYDFGDGWTFPVRLEEIIDDKVYEEASPLVLEGEGLGIIEDVGGVGAMSDCVKASEKKAGDDYESYSEQLGIKDLDITYFNKSAVNKSLKKEIKAIDKAYKTMEQTYQKMEITYLIQKSRRLSISVSVMTDNRVLLKAPYGTTERTVHEFLLSKKDWITKHLEKQNRQYVEPSSS